MAFSAFSEYCWGTLSNIQPCSGILRDIKYILRHKQVLLSLIEPYSDIFRTPCYPCIHSHVIFRTLEHLECKASSKASQRCKMIRYIHDNLIKHLQIFRDINAYSATLTGSQLVRGSLPSPFLKIKRSALIFGEKTLIVSTFGLKFPFKIILNILGFFLLDTLKTIFWKCSFKNI